MLNLLYLIERPNSNLRSISCVGHLCRSRDGPLQRQTGSVEQDRARARSVSSPQTLRNKTKRAEKPEGQEISQKLPTNSVARTRRSQALDK